MKPPAKAGYKEVGRMNINKTYNTSTFILFTNMAVSKTLANTTLPQNY